MTIRDHWVYRAYDADGTCLYIGCSKSPEQRAKAHRTNHIWFQHMTRAVLAGPYPQAVALRIESEQIATMQPKHNRRGVKVPVDPHPLAPNVSTTRAAHFLGMTELHVLRAVHRGDIKGYNVGSEIQPRFIFLKSDLEELTGREVA